LTPADIDRQLRALYGEVDWAAATGVVQVAAIGGPDRRMIVPGEQAPASETDRFVLAAARARADAILTSGANLRAEPELRFEFAGSDLDSRAFFEWRSARLARPDPPNLIVLSASGEIPIEHPALRGASAGFVWTTAAGASRLGGRVGALEVVVGDPDLDGVVGAIRAARGDSGIETLLIEAGPRASAPLYHQGLAGEHCDELLLSRFEGELAPLATGPRFVSDSEIESCFALPPSETRIVDSSGAWRLYRYRIA
jgi:riboflavin biosynthesis pyrimidine reductase